MRSEDVTESGEVGQCCGMLCRCKRGHGVLDEDEVIAVIKGRASCRDAHVRRYTGESERCYVSAAYLLVEVGLMEGADGAHNDDEIFVVLESGDETATGRLVSNIGALDTDDHDRCTGGAETRCERHASLNDIVSRSWLERLIDDARHQVDQHQRRSPFLKLRHREDSHYSTGSHGTYNLSTRSRLAQP